jgi:hypothetical protein
MSCSVNVQQIIGPLNTLVIERQEDAGDPGSITTTNIIISNDVLQQIEVVDICRGTQGPSGPPGAEGPPGPSGLPGPTFDILPIVSGGTNNNSFSADYIIYYDGASDQLASSNYTIDDIIAGAQALTGIVEGSGIQKTDLGNNQIKLDAIVGDGLDVHRTTNAIFVDGTIARLDDLTPGQFQGVLPVSKGGTANTSYLDGKLITFDSTALNGSGQFISAGNLNADEIVVSGNGFTLAAGSGLVNGGFVIIPNGTGRIDIPESADITVFADSFELSQTGTPGTYTKVTTDSKGRVEAGGQLTPSDIYNILGYIPWHSGNDGCGSLLDADMLCGQSGDYYLDATNITGIINTGVLPDIMVDGRYTKVDVNTKGLVTSGMQMTPQDIEDILGYDPVRPTGGVDFCGDIELHGSLFINKPTGCPGATSGLLRVYDNMPLIARNNADIGVDEPRGVSFVYGGGFIARTGSIAYYPTEDVVYVTTNMTANNNGVDGGDSDDDFQDDVNGGDANSTFPISNLTGTKRLLLYKDTADELYVSLTKDQQIVAGFKKWINGIGVNDQVIIYDNDGNPTVPPTNVGSNTLLNVNFNADLLDSQHGEYYLDANNITGIFDPTKVSFGFIEGTKNYIPKFDGDNNPANIIRDSVMYEDGATRDITIGEEKNLIVGANQRNDQSPSTRNAMIGEDNGISSADNSLLVGQQNQVHDAKNVIAAGFKASGLKDNSIAHGKYGTTWLENQIAHGAYRVDDSNNLLIEHGQASDYMMYLEGQTATNWANLIPSVQLPDDTTLAFKVSMLMNSAFSTGVAEFEFYSGIVKNVKLRDPSNISEIINVTTIMQQPKKNEIYNNSHIHDYYLQLMCTELNEIQNETIKVNDSPIDLLPIRIDNEPTEIISKYEDPDGYNATYLKDNLGNMSITLDAASITGNYVGSTEGDLRVSCRDHGLLQGEYAYIEFTSHNQVSFPDDRYLVKSVVDENTFVLQGLHFRAEKQTDNSLGVLTILPDDIRKLDSANTVTMTGLTRIGTNGYEIRDDNQVGLNRFLSLASPDSHLEVTINNDPNAKHYCLYRNFSIDNFNRELLEVDSTDSSGTSVIRDISYKDYTYEFIRKAESLSVSGTASTVNWLNSNTTSLAKYVEGGNDAYTAITVNGDTYLSPITDNIEVIGPAPTGMSLYLAQTLSSVNDGDIVNISVTHTGVEGTLKVRQRQKHTGSYQRIQYNPNEQIDCVYTLYPSEDPALPARVHIYAEDYQDLGLLDNPYEFVLYDDLITPTDNDKFKIVSDNDVYYLYTAVDMPMSNISYTVEIRAINVYGEVDIDQILQVNVSDTLSLANNEKGLDSILLTNNTIATGTPADTYVGTISGNGGYNPYVVFDTPYNGFEATFVSGTDLVTCTGNIKKYDTTELIGDPCFLCSGSTISVDFKRFSVPDRTLEVLEVYCETGLAVSPVFNNSAVVKFVWTDPSQVGSVINTQTFNVNGSDIQYTVTDTGLPYGFEALAANTTVPEITGSFEPNIEWIEYTGLASELYDTASDVNYTTTTFTPSQPISGLQKDVGQAVLDFPTPVTGLVLWFRDIESSNSQDGYILQQDSFKIALEDSTGFIQNDSDYSNSGLLVADRPIYILEGSNALSNISDNIIPFSGASIDMIVCMTGVVSGEVRFSVLADAGTNYKVAVGELQQYTFNSNSNPVIRVSEVYEDTIDNQGAVITYTGTPIDSGNYIISGLKEGPVFRSCQENDDDGFFGYETQANGLCYVTGECKVYSSIVGPDGEGEAVYRVTFPENIYISYDSESYIQLSNWTPTDSNPNGEVLITPSDGHYPITEVSGISNNSFLIPEQYAIALPVDGTGLSSQGTVSGSFDIYHEYKSLPSNIINQVPGDFLTVERTYNPPVLDPDYRPKNDLFDILSIQGNRIITEDKKNYVLIEDDRPPYLDHTIRGIYTNDSREFYANVKRYGNRLIDLRFEKDLESRRLPYADGPWAYKDLYVGADYDHVNKRLILFNLPTGVYKPMDRIQISFQNPNDLQSIGICSEPQYFEFPADHMYVYTGLPVTEFETDGVGDIQFTLSDQPPQGWVKLDGSTYNINQYPALKQYLDYYRLRYTNSDNICWAASTLPDFRNANVIGSGVAPWNNLGELVDATGFIPLSGEEPDNYYDPPLNVVGFWIMKAEGSFFDPNIPINLGDSGNINYVIDNFDLGPNSCNSSNQISFSTTGCRVRLDILQFLEPDLRFNVSEFTTNDIYQVSGINHDYYQDQNYPCSDEPLSDQTLLYTPLNPVTVKPRAYNGNYAVVVSPDTELLNFETDSGVLGLYTKEELRSPNNPPFHWWPLGIYVKSETDGQGPLSTPVAYTSGYYSTPNNPGFSNAPTGYATSESPLRVEVGSDINPSPFAFYHWFYTNESFDYAPFDILVSGDSSDQNDPTQVILRIYDENHILEWTSCFNVNQASQNADGCIISDGNGGGDRYNLPSFYQLEIEWVKEPCNGSTAGPPYNGWIHTSVSGAAFTSSQGTCYIVEPDNANTQLRTDFNQYAATTFDLQLYQLPSVTMSSNFCGNTDRANLKWFTHAHKMHINNFNTPRSYLEYGDEFKIIKLNNDTNFGDNVTNLLTKINPTSEDSSLSGLSTSDELCRYKPCYKYSSDEMFNSWRYPVIWGTQETKGANDYPWSYAQTDGPPYGAGPTNVNSFPQGAPVTMFIQVESDAPPGIPYYAEAGIPGVGFIRADENTPVASFTTKSTTTDIGVTSNIDNNINPNNPYYVRWTLFIVGGGFPYAWTDPLVNYAILSTTEWLNTTYGSLKLDVDDIHHLPAEWCNTGQYEDKYRSVKPVANNLATQVPFTGTCEFSQSISGRMYIPENNNLYFHTHGETTAYWPLDENGSGIPHQQTGIYIIGDQLSSSSINSCGSGLACIEISGFNNVDLTGIPTVGDRENIGVNPIVIESNGVTGIVGNYGANKQFYFDFDDGLPQLSNVYNVIDYVDGRKKIVISVPDLPNLSNKSGLVFMIENPKNIKSHLNPNLSNEFIVSDPTVTPEEIFSTQINHFDYCTKRWKHLLHFDWDVIGTGYQEIKINTGNEESVIDLFPIPPTGISISGIRYTDSLSNPFTDVTDITSDNTRDSFYVQLVTLYGTPSFTQDIYQDLPKVTISGLQDFEYELDPLTDVTNYHGSGWNITMKVNRTNEIIDSREIVFRAEDATGKADTTAVYNQIFLPELLQSYTGYSLPGTNDWEVIYDTLYLDLDNINNNNILTFEMQGTPTVNPINITYERVRDNVLRVYGPVDPGVVSTTYYSTTIIAKTGLTQTEVARCTGLVVDLRDAHDWTPVPITLNNFRSFGERTDSGNFYAHSSGQESFKFDVPQPQGSVLFTVSHLNQDDVSSGVLGYEILYSYSNTERRFNVEMIPTGTGEVYPTGMQAHYPNNQLEIEMEYEQYDVNGQLQTPNAREQSFPIFNTTLYTGLIISNSNPDTIKYYKTDEPWQIQVKVSGGITDHNPSLRPNVRVFNAPNKGNYEKPKEPVDCIITYQYQDDPGNACWLVQANARRDIFGNYMPNNTGEFQLYVNVDDTLTDYATLNDSANINDQFTIIYTKPSGFINLPPTVYSVPGAPFFTKCDVLSQDSGNTPNIIRTNQSDPGFNLTDECNPGMKWDGDFPLWQRGYRGTTTSSAWDAKVEISTQGTITASVKGLGKDKVMAVAKVEFLEIESDQLVDVPFRIKEVTPEESESEQFGQEGIIVEQGKAWQLQVTTEGGLADARYPPTIVLTGMPTFCTGYNPMDGDSNDDLACIDGEPSFGNGEWTFRFEGEPSCDLLGIKPFGILAIDTLTGIPPSYLATDTHQGQFIYETGEFFVLPPEISFTGETDLYPFCDICYTGYIDFGPQVEDDLDCNSVTGIKTIRTSGTLPEGLRYGIYFPADPPTFLGSGQLTGRPNGERQITLAAPYNNLSSGYIAITGCPTEFAGGGPYPDEFFAEVCNAVDECADLVVTFEDASKPFDPNLDFVYFFSQTGAVLSPKSGEDIVGTGPVAGSRAPNAQEYNVECQSILPHAECKVFHVFYSGNNVDSYISGIYPEGTSNNDKIDLQTNPNNFVYFKDEDNPLNDGRFAAIPAQSPFNIDFEIVAVGLANASTGTGLLVVEDILAGSNSLDVDKLDDYFPSPFNTSTTKCVLGGGEVGFGTIQGQGNKYGLRGHMMPRLSGFLSGDDAVFKQADEYMSGVTFVEVNADTDIPLISVLEASDCWQTGEMRISGVIPPSIQAFITDPPPAANTNYSSLTDSFSFLTRLAYGTTANQQSKTENQRTAGLQYRVYNMTQGANQITQGFVTSNSPFQFQPTQISGVVYSVQLFKLGDEYPTNNIDHQNYTESYYTWIHKGLNANAAPTAAAFPPIFPTGFGSGVFATFGSSTNIDGLAYGGYTIPTSSQETIMISNSVSPVPYWQDGSNTNWSNADYLPQISGMVLSQFDNVDGVWVTGGSVDIQADPDVFTIPVPDDFVEAGYPVNIVVQTNPNSAPQLDYTFVLEQSNLLGSSPVTGITFDSPIPWNFTSNFQNDDVTIDKSILLVSGIRQVNGFDSHLVVRHSDTSYSIGDLVVVDSPSGTSATYTACNAIDLEISDGDTTSIVVSPKSPNATNETWLDSLISPDDLVTLYKQEVGEIYVDPNSVSLQSQGIYEYSIVGTPNTLYKDYNFRITTCENPNMPVADTNIGGDPDFVKQSSTDYPLFVSKPISVFNTTVTGTKTSWIIRLEIEGGLRPVQNNSPRVLLKYGNNLLGTLCGFDRTIDRLRQTPTVTSQDQEQSDNVLLDEYDAQNDRIIIELRANSDYAWGAPASPTAITVRISDITGEVNHQVQLPQ